MKGPELAQLIEDPSAVARLTGEAAADLLALTTALGMALAARVVSDRTRAQPGVPDRLLSLEEASERLRLTKRYVTRLAKTGELAAILQGRYWLFRESALLEWQESTETRAPLQPRGSSGVGVSPRRRSR